MAGPTKILLTDSLKSGWRTKHNLNVDELIVSAIDKGNGTAELVKFGGAKVVLNFLTSFFSKTQTQEVIAAAAGVKLVSPATTDITINIPQYSKLTTLDVLQASGSPDYVIEGIQPETNLYGSGSCDSYNINRGGILGDTSLRVHCTNGEVKLIYVIIPDFYK